LAVVLMGVPPALELRVVAQPTQQSLAYAFLVLAAAAGVYAAIRRRPLGLRVTTVAYGVFGIGLGLFATNRPISQLLAYAVGLIGMNVLLYHVHAYGPVLAAFKEDDAVSRRARAVVLRSLAFSGAVLAVAYGGSLVLLPLFAIEAGSQDPLAALALASALLLLFLVLALLPDVSLRRKAVLRNR